MLSMLGAIASLRNARRWVGGLSPSVTRVLGYRLIIVTWWVGG